MLGGGADRSPDKVGDYNLNSVVLINSVGDRVELPMGTIAELNVFEDIYSNAVTGTAHIVDAYNIIANAALQGNERIAFTLSTDPREDTADAIKPSTPQDPPLPHSRDPGGLEIALAITPPTG